MKPDEDAHSAKKLSPDTSTLDALAKRYSTSLTRFFSRRVENHSDVPDLVQEVFLRLAKLGEMANIRNTEHYLFTTAASVLKDQYRHDSSHRRQEHEEFDESSVAGSAISPERVYSGRESVYRLQQAIRRLPERTRDIVVLRLFEGLKIAAIARTLGISQRAVEKHYAKGVARIAVELKEFRDD